jgi:hypothetical protein
MLNGPFNTNLITSAPIFFKKTGMPYVHGVIDCTHIEILKPIDRIPAPETFYNSKGFFSLNCLMVPS